MATYSDLFSRATRQLMRARAGKPPKRSSTTPIKHSRLESGIFKPKALSCRAKGHAETRLCNLRIQLRRYLYKEPKFRDKDGGWDDKVAARARMLGQLDYDGRIEKMACLDPDAKRKYKTAEEMERKRAVLSKLHPSPLSRALRVEDEEEEEESEEESEGEEEGSDIEEAGSGMLPGEVFVDEFDRDMQMEVEFEVWDRGYDEQETMEYMETAGACNPGFKLEGAWQQVCEGPDGFEVSVAAQWAWDCEVQAVRVREGAVMDPKCRGVVQSVWAAASRL
ncbi:hypothetical protein BDV95DRAFT_605130 [Massariosphaeria phaeospora]|uniref:Uncharacterized protein n=1 Tax=Massariosphaeria phaeospora TaxID=100035 RepID=A0A7C8MEU7_9PLEO|nr:hypothetical protein BDV95DRAFT_605130 [Massariosphaeria phaeospora]